jgi:hypothetical protein
MEKIALMGTLSKNRRWIKKSDYQKLYDFILMEVHAKPGIQLQELLDCATEKLAHHLPNFYMLLLQVKHDMEARGVIDTNFDHLRNQMIMPRYDRHSVKLVPNAIRMSSFGL